MRPRTGGVSGRVAESGATLGGRCLAAGGALPATAQDDDIGGAYGVAGIALGAWHEHDGCRDTRPIERLS